MYLIVWSIILIAFASQCLFLTATLAVKPTANKQARFLLIAMLLVVLCISISNLSEATFLYRKINGIANLGRGMVFLLGPVLYLYTLSVLKPSFKLNKFHLLHFIPYLLALAVIQVQNRGVPDQIIVLAVDSLMQGKAVMNPVSTLWFIFYFFHIAIYIFAIRREMLSGFSRPGGNYMIPLNERIAWLKKITIAFGLIVAVFLGIIAYIFITGYYTIYGNFIYTLVLGSTVYVIAFQAISNNRTLKPDFDIKYKSINQDTSSSTEMLSMVLHTFEHEKIFLDPNLRIETLAKKINTTPHIISRTVNEGLGKNFSELVSHYRIDEFKKRLNEAKYARYSIIGIAYDVGFNSKSSFNGAFKKQTGFTPSQYQKLVLTGPDKKNKI